MMVPLSEIIRIGLELSMKEENLKDCLGCFLPFGFKIYQDKHCLHIRQRERKCLFYWKNSVLTVRNILHNI